MDRSSKALTLFLCGDVMTGRGIDQILPHPVAPRIHESYAKSALEYVDLAERANGRIPRPGTFGYPWGDALTELNRRQPDLRIINLETSITTSEDAVPKGINYRMHPANAGCITVAGIDCCSVANNHVLDWGYRGLAETLATLRKARVHTAGAGESLADASAPAVRSIRSGARVLVFGVGGPGCGIPPDWAATTTKPGIALVPDLAQQTAARLAATVNRIRRAGDVVVVSLHWGPNWGYTVAAEQRAFAHRLIDLDAADILHGHSSHHPQPFEVYRKKLILYGCGDFLNDYEGIGGYEQFRSHLVLMYFVSVEAATGEVIELEMKPLEIKRFRLRYTSDEDARWLRDMFNREGSTLGISVALRADGVLRAAWR